MEPPKKATFPPEFCSEICAIFVCTIKKKKTKQNKKKKKHDPGKKKKKKVKYCIVSKWRPNNQFLFCASFRFWAKFEKKKKTKQNKKKKNLFLNGIFQ